MRSTLLHADGSTLFSIVLVGEALQRVEVSAGENLLALAMKHFRYRRDSSSALEVSYTKSPSMAAKRLLLSPRGRVRRDRAHWAYASMDLSIPSRRRAARSAGFSSRVRGDFDL